MNDSKNHDIRVSKYLFKQLFKMTEIDWSFINWDIQVLYI